MYTIRNEYLTVGIHEKGATLWSIKDKENKEYLWQGDPQYWADRAPNIFPYIARLTDKKYVLDGKTYKMDIHGFAKDMIFKAEQVSESHIVFTLCDSDETYNQYPYKFCFSVIYKLEGTKILITYFVKNNDNKVMFFGVGGHPGFNVPFDEDTVFEDYYLEFDAAGDVKRVRFSEDCFVIGGMDSYPLEEGTRLYLQHDLFDHDAVVLANMAHGITLKSEKSKKAIRVEYPDMQYLGIWHSTKKAAPYVCIEPWSSLPSRKGIVEDLATQPGLISLDAKCEYENRLCIELIDKLFQPSKEEKFNVAKMMEDK